MKEARAEGEWHTARELGRRAGTDYFPFYRGPLERDGWLITKRPGRTPTYQLAASEPDIGAVLPRAPRPSLRTIRVLRAAQDLATDRCDFCLRSEHDLGHALQVDHAQPELYFGTTTATRWLLACRQCNTTKRTAGCRRCPNADPTERSDQRCDTCFWGAPHGDFVHIAGQPVVTLPVDPVALLAFKAMRRYARRTRQSLSQALADAADSLEDGRHDRRGAT